MNYQWKPGARIKADPNAAGKMCEDLEKSPTGLTAKALVDANRPEDAPLHDYFEWRDDVAAELYRERQGYHVINCICVKAEEKDKQPMRAFFVVEQKSGYESINVIVKNEDKYARLKESAKRELIAFKRKYAQILEIQPAIDDAIEQLSFDIPA